MTDQNEISSMDREEFAALAQTRVGEQWKGACADFLGINRRTVERWYANGEFPQWAVDRLRSGPAALLLERACAFADLVNAAPAALSLADVQPLLAAVELYRQEMAHVDD